MTTFDQRLVEEINKLNGSWPWGNLLLCSIALVLCILFCGFLGFEREKRGRSAGLRTHVLVGVGSCIIMIISIYGFPSGIISTTGGRDVARLAAGVLAGVGFLGAGAIIHDHGSIKGLTTAGTLWLAMAIGLACGSFNFILATGAVLIVLIVLTAFRRIESNISKRAPMFVVLAKEDVPVMSIILDYAKKHDLLVHDINSQITKENGETLIQTTFKFTSENKRDLDSKKLEEDIASLTKAVSVLNVNRH